MENSEFGIHVKMNVGSELFKVLEKHWSHSKPDDFTNYMELFYLLITKLQLYNNQSLREGVGTIYTKPLISKSLM